MELALSKEVKIDLVAAAATSAGTAVDGSSVDMQGYDAVLFVCSIATANAGNFLKASQSSDDGVGDGFSDLAGSKTIVDTNGDIAILEVRKPMKRYVKPHIIRAGTNTATGDVYALRYNSRMFPQVNDVLNTSNVVSLISPEEGTA